MDTFKTGHFHSLDLPFQNCLSISRLHKTYVRVDMVGGQFVQVQQSLVDVLLQLQGTLHGLQPAPPLVTLWFLRKKNSQL